MPHIIADRVRETTTTTGTGPLTLAGAPTGFRAFSAVCANGDTVAYAVEHQTTGEWETGIGTWGTGGILTRTTVRESSNGNAAVNFTAGTKNVWLAVIADQTPQFDHANNLFFPDSTSDPATPAGGVMLFLRSRAGRRLLTMLGPSGVDNVLQPQLWGNRVMLWLPGSGTGLGSFGISPTTAATLSHPTPATTSLAESLYRTRFATSTTAGNAAGVRDAVNTIWRGNAAGAGGFFAHFRVASGSIGLAGGQAIVGLSSSTGALGGEPSALADVLGIGYDSGDTNWQFMRRAGTGTVQKTDLGVAKSTLNALFDLTFYAAPNASSIGVRVVRYTSFSASTVLLDTTHATDIPAAATLLGRHCQIRNGAASSAANLDLVRAYLESDF